MTTILNYAKANWQIFKKELEAIDTNEILLSNDSDEINNFITESLLKAANKAIPVKLNNQQSCIRLPKHVMNLIHMRRKIKKQLMRIEFGNKEGVSYNK